MKDSAQAGRMMVDSAIEIDGSTRWPIIFITGRFEMSDVPRSPCSSLFSQVMNCTISGSLRPSEVRIRSSRSGVALSPARIAAGSPGVRRSRRKTNSATTPITGTAARIRRRRYPSKLDPVRLESNQRQRLEPGSCHQPNISAIPMPSEPRFLQCGHLALVTWPGFGVVARPLLESREQPRHQPAAFDQTFNLDILFERVAVAATHAQAVESRDAHCAREIAVGAAAGARMRQFSAERLGDPARLFIQRHGAGIGLPNRTCHAARHLERDIIGC